MALRNLVVRGCDVHRCKYRIWSTVRREGTAPWLRRVRRGGIIAHRGPWTVQAFGYTADATTGRCGGGDETGGDAGRGACDRARGCGSECGRLPRRLENRQRRGAHLRILDPRRDG